jgi:hypothetical protein
MMSIAPPRGMRSPGSFTGWASRTSSPATFCSVDWRRLVGQSMGTLKTRNWRLRDCLFLPSSRAGPNPGRGRKAPSRRARVAWCCTSDRYSQTLTDQVVFFWLLGNILTPVVTGLGPGRVSPSWATASVKPAVAASAWPWVEWIVLISTWNLLAQTSPSSAPGSIATSKGGCPTARRLALGAIALVAFLAPKNQEKGWQCKIGRQREAGSYWV